MSRFLFLVLLVAVLALAVHIGLTVSAPPPDLAARERHPEAIRILAVTPPARAARNAEETQRMVKSLTGAACVEFAGFAATDLQRARQAVAALGLGDRVTEHGAEDVSRYWVYVPAAPDRRTAEASAAQLRRLGVTDLSIRPDNAISLGIFSNEEGGRRFLAALEAKGVKGAVIGPFQKEVRDVSLLVRDPDTETVARLAILQRDFAGSRLRAVACPAG